MNNIFYPKKNFHSIYNIDLNSLIDEGVRGLILDIDNTLVGHGILEADKNVVNWIENAKNLGLKLCIISNNTETRVIKFTESLKIPAIHRAHKPRRNAFLSGAKIMELEPATVAVVGDQIFTDILGGNRLGMLTILVSPVGVDEPFFIKLKRLFEKMVLIRYNKNK